MNANSHSEAVWQVLHQAGALLTGGGFSETVPPLPASSRGEAENQAPAQGYEDLAARYGEHLAFGTGWPQGIGSARPLALVLTEASLTEEALAFVRSWFENARVNLVLADHFFIQPLPTLDGEKPPYQALARDLGTLFQPKAFLSLGAAPAQRLLGAPLSLDTLRGSDYRFDRWSMITTLDPEGFVSLAEEEKTRFKGQIWKDLQRLLGKLRYG